MERKEKYKHHAHNVEKIRSRRRKEERALRKHRRHQVVTAKRLKSDNTDAEQTDVTVEQVVAAVEDLKKKSEDRTSVLQMLRTAFSQGTTLIDAFLGVEGALSTLVSILTGSDPELELEAARCLTNMSAGTDQEAMIIIKAAGPYLITYLSSSNTALQDQCAWTLGNIAGDGHECRLLLDDQGILAPLQDLLKSPVPSVVQSAAFALSNMAREGAVICKKLVDAGVLKELIPHLFYKEDNKAILSECSWVLTYIAACGQHEAELVSSGVLDRIVAILDEVALEDSENYKILTPLLRSLGNICSGSDDDILRVCQDKCIFTALEKCLRSEHRHVRKECLWVISNITANAKASEEVLSHGLLKPIIELMHSPYDIKEEAAYCLCNIACHGEASSKALVDNGVIQATIPLLKAADITIIQLALHICEIILRNTQEGAALFEQHDGLSGIDALEYHNNEDIRTMTTAILVTHFYKEDAIEDIAEAAAGDATGGAAGDAAEDAAKVAAGEAAKDAEEPMC